MRLVLKSSLGASTRPRQHQPKTNRWTKKPHLVKPLLRTEKENFATPRHKCMSQLQIHYFQIFVEHTSYAIQWHVNKGSLIIRCYTSCYFSLILFVVSDLGLIFASLLLSNLYPIFVHYYIKHWQVLENFNLIGSDCSIVTVSILGYLKVKNVSDQNYYTSTCGR